MSADLEIGTIYGAWKVVKLLESRRYLCLCTACGNSLQDIRRYDLEQKKTLMCKSCSKSSTSGITQDPKTAEVYNTWVSMNQRCYNSSSKDYKNYGARGITIYPIWRDSFEAFYMQIGPRPAPDYTIERIDYEQGYFPGNVKWIPRAEQPKNKRDNIRVTIKGVTKLVSEWEDDPSCSVDKFTIYKRLKRGWPSEAAVLVPNGVHLKAWKKANED